MDPKRASQTALMAAYSRYFHSKYFENPVFDDWLAGSLLSEAEKESIAAIHLQSVRTLRPDLMSEDPIATLRSWIAISPASPGFYVRARLAEERLLALIEQGVTQYVIIGAGLDTFALRRPDLAEKVTVYEVDHPATQDWKRDRLKGANFDVPGHLKFVGADLELETLKEALDRTSFDTSQASFFSWMGVTPYLSREAIGSTFDSIRSLSPRGGEVVFDYFDARIMEPSNRTPLVERVFQVVKEAGEPFITGFATGELGPFLAQHGFRMIEDLGPEETGPRYFSGRKDALYPVLHSRCAVAAVVG